MKEEQLPDTSPPSLPSGTITTEEYEDVSHDLSPDTSLPQSQPKRNVTVYIVKHGDTLASVALRYDMQVKGMPQKHCINACFVIVTIPKL
jgi:LysM repeat protein